MDRTLSRSWGARSAMDAVKAAAESPLIEKGLKGARGVILNLTGDSSLSLYDVDEATRYIMDNSDEEVNIILGTVIDNSVGGKVQATIIATDFVDSVVMKSPTVKVPESKVKKETFSLDTPSFMSKPAAKEEQNPSGAFAIPAFRLTVDDKEKK